MAIRAMVQGATKEIITSSERSVIEGLKRKEEKGLLPQGTAANYEASKAAVFIIRTLNVHERSILENFNVYETLPDGSVRKKCYGDAIGYACAKGLIGWRNILDKNDGQSKFKGKKDSEGEIVGADIEDLNRIHQDDLEEIYQEVVAFNTLSDPVFLDLSAFQSGSESTAKASTAANAPGKPVTKTDSGQTA